MTQGGGLDQSEGSDKSKQRETKLHKGSRGAGIGVHVGIQRSEVLECRIK